MFSRFFKKSSLVSGTPPKKSPDDSGVSQRFDLFLGHTVTDSPASPSTDSPESEARDERVRYFEEPLVVDGSSPCGSYVDITDSRYFDPRDVNKRNEVVATFIRQPLAMSLLSVPGIGVRNNNILESNGIHNTHQLIGQFLVFRNKKTSPIDLADKFYQWLGDVGVHHNRATITASVAEKIGTWIPGVYDTSVYTSW